MIFKTLVIIFLIGIGCDTTNIYNELKKIRKIKEQTNEKRRNENVMKGEKINEQFRKDKKYDT